MFKNIIFIAILTLFTLRISAQEKIVIENNPDYEFQSDKNQTTQKTVVKQKVYTFQPRWSFGGNIGLAFWNGGTDIFLAPKAYYHVSPKFITGIGVTYIYSDGQYWTNNIIGYTNYHSNSFGGSFSALFRPIPYVQFSAEYEGLQTEWRGGRGFSDSYFNNAIYLGASYVSGSVSFGFRYDVLYDANRSVYGSAWTPFIGFYF